MNFAETITICVPSNYGTLRHVVSAAITGSPATVNNFHQIHDPVLIRQTWHNRMTPFGAD